MSQYNPYAAPQAGPPMLPGAPGPGGGSGPQPWEIGEVLGHAWTGFKANWATLVFSQLLALILGSIPNYIPSVLVATQAIENASAEYWIIYSICLIAGIIVSTFFQVGLTKIALSAARQQSAQFGDLFSGGSRYFSLLGATLLLSLAAFFGVLLFIVPGVILMLGLSLTAYFVVDQNMGPIQAMQASWAATTGHKGGLFLYGLVGGLLVIGGCVACYVGIFVALPVFTVGMATIYLRLSGQWGAGTGASYGPPGGYGPPAGGYGPPGGGGGGFGPPAGGGGYGPPAGGGGYGPPPGGGGTGGGGYGPPPGY